MHFRFNKKLCLQTKSNKVGSNWARHRLSTTGLQTQVYKHSHTCMYMQNIYTNLYRIYAYTHPHKETTQGDLTRSGWGTALSAPPQQWGDLAVGKCDIMCELWQCILTFTWPTERRCHASSLPPTLVILCLGITLNSEEYREGGILRTVVATELSWHQPPGFLASKTGNTQLGCRLTGWGSCP